MTWYTLEQLAAVSGLTRLELIECIESDELAVMYTISGAMTTDEEFDRFSKAKLAPAKKFPKRFRSKSKARA